MKYPLIPEKPENRKMIILLNGGDIEMLKIKGDTSGILDNKDICVLETPILPSQRKNNIYQSLTGVSEIQGGNIYIQNAFNVDKYDELKPNLSDNEEFIFGYAKKKIYAFIAICELLGAKRVSTVSKEKHYFQENISSESKIETKEKVKGVKDSISVDAARNFELNNEISKNLNSRIEKEISIKSESKGLSKKEINFEKVQEELNNNIFAQEETLKHLIESRKSKNPKNKIEVSLNYTSEVVNDFRFYLDIACKLSISLSAILGAALGTVGGSLSVFAQTDYKKSTRAFIHSEIIHLVEFPDEKKSIIRKIIDATINLFTSKK